MTKITKQINLRQGFYRDSRDALVYLFANHDPLNCQIEYPGQRPQTMPRSEIREFTYVSADTEDLQNPEEKKFVIGILERELAGMPSNQARFMENLFAFRTKSTEEQSLPK